ncbi:MAG: alkaline phosphatase family protein [Verrucomicrobiia bacterium]
MRTLSRNLVAVAILISAAVLWTGNVFAAGKAEHVVVVVMDGLRPDFVTEKYMPTLHKLAGEGVLFKNHHAVYVSSTEANGAALATGCYPSRDTILANREHRPALDPLKRIEIVSLSLIRKADALTGGRYIPIPTVAEILQRAGHKTAIAGAKPVVLLHDRAERPATGNCCVNLYAGRTLPESALNPITAAQSAFPPRALPNVAQDEWTTRALLGNLWKQGVPKFSLLWLSEPDATQHADGPGAGRALAALKSSDKSLGLVLQELERRGLRNKTDIFIVSDHGLSTISRRVDVAEALKNAGFAAAREFKQPPAADEIMVIGSGGSALLYVTGHDPNVIGKVVEFLQQQDFTGAIFTQKPAKGTFALEQIRAKTPDAPDIIVSLRWTADKSAAGVPGMLLSDGSPAATGGGGQHGSLSAFDMHNTLVAAGPDFRHGLVDGLPSGNVDVAPTILWIAGVEPPQPMDGAPSAMDGRILAEAMVGIAAKLTPIQARTLETSNELPKGFWRQYLRVTEFGGAIYLDEANGTFVPKAR